MTNDGERSQTLENRERRVFTLSRTLSSVVFTILLHERFALGVQKRRRWPSASARRVEALATAPIDP